MSARTLQRGGSEAKAVQKSRREAVAYFDVKTQKAQRAELQKLREAASLAKKQVRSECAQKRRNARQLTRDARAKIARELLDMINRIDLECAERAEKIVAPLVRDVEKLAGEIHASALARRSSKARTAARPTLSAREALEKQWDEVRQDIDAVDPSLRAVFEKVKRGLRPTDRQTMSEAFFEYVNESPELVERQQSKHDDVDADCVMAREMGRAGDRDAGKWADDNCTQAGARRRGRR